MIDPIEFRRVMGRFPTGVAIVTSCRPNGEPCGLTLNSFCSVSLEPCLILVCVDRLAESHDCIIQHGTFGVNILGDGRGEYLSRRFAEPQVNRKFTGISFRSGGAGVPILEEALAWLECRVIQTIPGGDHTIFLGEVIEADAREGHPLVYYRGGYGRFDP
jgi:flavin reductase (DIM6/NTAB) family NADH-FMN oxidoreductase RutF